MVNKCLSILRSFQTLLNVAGKKVFWFSLLIAVLMTLLAPPSVLLAQEAKVDLSLRMLSEYYYREVIPGEENTLYMEIRNNGDTEINNIRFDSDEPKGWTVDFIPDRISRLSAGSSQTVEVNVLPGRGTRRGEYSLTLLAEAEEARAVASTMLRVESGSSLWMIIGGVVAALVIVGFVLIYLRLGRE